jgi:hypothetical protein
MRNDSHQVAAAFTNDREWVAATDEFTREIETLARAVDSFTGTGAYDALAREGVSAGSDRELELAHSWG